MRAILPGKPEPWPQALATGFWDSRSILTYITGNAFTILQDPRKIIQTIYDDDETPLEAIAFDEASGKIATCTSKCVRVYKPFGKDEGTLKWAQQLSFSVPDPSPKLPCVLSWGASEELLVATSALALYLTKHEAVISWTKPLPTPVRSAAISYDSSYIASAGHTDRLVKIWRRLTYGSEGINFGLSYLGHLQPVTGVRWRKPYHAEQTMDNVLYTFCTDNLVRIWVAAEASHCPHFVLWGTVDAGLSISKTPSARPWVTVLDGREFAAAVEREVQLRASVEASGDGGALDHLIAVANKNPEICLVFDGVGTLSAWAVENVSSATLGSSAVFSLSHVRTRDFEFLTPSEREDHASHVELCSYYDRSAGQIQLLLHSLDGKIVIYQAPVANLLDPTSAAKRHLFFNALLSGQSAPIKKMIRNFSGRAVVSRTAEGEATVWKHITTPTSTRLALLSVIPEKGHVRRISVLRKGRFVVFLCDHTISLWDSRRTPASLMARCNHNIAAKPLCLLILPRRDPKDYTVAHLATVTSDQDGLVWEFRLPDYGNPNSSTASGKSQGSIREFSRFALRDAEGLAYVLPVDPAGASPVLSGFLDIFARDIAVSYTHTGRVNFWTARIDQNEDTVGWLSTSCTETRISDPALVSGSTLKKAALIDSTRSQLTIWDIGGARLEYTEYFKDRETVQDLDWTSTPDLQSILAVGFQYRVVLMSQMRYDYLNKGPAWAAIREINIRDITPHPIGDSTWLSDGNLVIGSGHQLYVHNRHFGASNSLVAGMKLPPRRYKSWDLFEVVQRANGPLSVFHPQFLSQCILAGKTSLVRQILVALHNTLKFHIDGESMDDYLGIDLEDFYLRSSSTSRRTAKIYLDRRQSSDATEEMEAFSEDMATKINERLTRTAIAQISGHEQIQLADIIECAGMVEKQRRSLDENGARFVLFFRQHALRKGRTNEINLSWREINWAFHSTSQDILTDVVSRQYHGKLLWKDARESGMFMWLKDHNAIKLHLENVARNEYTKGELKNPVDCSLFYIALRKKTMLQGLWRMASWNREQVATQKLLANNFDHPRWRRAALKNAYALLSKHRFEYAACFFLLADRLQDAVSVCLNQIKDLQLAIAIARVYEGDEGPVLRKVLEEEVLPIAATEGNRWLASWTFWILRRRDMAVRSLIAPVYTLLETPCHPDMMSQSFLTNDPALVVLYSQLRQQTLQTLRGASKVTPKVEWEFVLHSAKVYDRMGCDLLGLDLVRNWEFLPSSAPTASTVIEDNMNLLRLAGRRASFVVADLPVSPLGMGMKLGTGRQTDEKPAPTTFQEPETNSLLDSFGF